MGWKGRNVRRMSEMEKRWVEKYERSKENWLEKVDL
jgi:hypothetical protein